MSLIICKECGKEYSDEAKACINCGCPNNSKQNEVKALSCAACKKKYPGDLEVCPYCSVSKGVENESEIIGNTDSYTNNEATKINILKKSLNKNKIILFILTLIIIGLITGAYFYFQTQTHNKELNVVEEVIYLERAYDYLLIDNLNNNPVFAADIKSQSHYSWHMETVRLGNQRVDRLTKINNLKLISIDLFSELIVATKNKDLKKLTTDYQNEIKVRFENNKKAIQKYQQANMDWMGFVLGHSEESYDWNFENNYTDYTKLQDGLLVLDELLSFARNDAGYNIANTKLLSYMQNNYSVSNASIEQAVLNANGKIKDALSPEMLTSVGQNINASILIKMMNNID